MKRLFENEAKEMKSLAGGKSSKDCSINERINVSRRMGGLAKRENETSEQHRNRVNAFRCGW